MGRNGRNAPPQVVVPPKITAVAGPGVKNSGKIMERLTALEKRVSKIAIHQTYFRVLDEWIKRMFGVELFPKPSESKKSDDDTVEDDNPFYELHQRFAALEERLESIGVPTVIPKATSKAFKTPAPPPPAAKSATVKRTYGTTAHVTRKSNATKVETVKKDSISSKSPAAVVLKAATPASVIPADKEEDTVIATCAANDTKDKPEEATTIATETVNDEKPDEKKLTVETEAEGDESIKTNEEKPEKDKKESDETDSDKPPALEQQVTENQPSESSEIKLTKDEEEEPVGEAAESDHVDEPDEDDEMDVDDEFCLEEEEEEYEEKPLLPSPEELAERMKVQVRGRPGRKRGPRGNKGVAAATASTSAEVSAADDDEPVVTYTTRGRRHKLPSRYAEFTGHDNVASILKSQQRAAAATQAAKAKKGSQEKEKPKTPSKPKASSAPKNPTPKKPPADGSRPECVYELIAKVQAKEVDEAGDVVLWDTFPTVKVNQQQLISVIFRSNGMSTRLTRKMTTLVFEDQVLENSSPFGTKYYSERLPPEPLEAMADFIVHSGFDPEYNKKKIYMIIGQVCNEARAGRVRNAALGKTPGTPQSTDEQVSS